jgi:iron complex outermembrane receptor protein
MKKTLHRVFQRHWLLVAICQLSWLPQQGSAQVTSSLVSLNYEANNSKAQVRLLKDILHEIEEKYGVSIIYEGALVDKHSVIFQIEKNNTKVEEVLNNLLHPLKFEVKKGNNNIYIIQQGKAEKSNTKPQSSTRATKPVFGQTAEITVQGKVTDATGEGVPGATVVLKGTTKGTATDVGGNFTLSVPSDGTLVISFIGYKAQEVPINNRSVINVALSTDAKALEEVVVVGYGTQQRHEITGSVASVTPKDFNSGVVARPDQLLVGKVAGLTINAPGGDPTATPTIQLRGPSSLTASSTPLYVIDGVPGADINLIPPTDIESIDVLKDASSAAIYGSRGANGVILITTKRGKSGKPTLTYSGYAALESIAKTLDVLSPQEYRDFVEEINVPVTGIEDGFNTDWQDEIYRTALSQSHNLSLRGGSEDSKYTTSLSYFKNNGTVKNNDLERVVGRLGLDQDLFNNRVRTGISLSNSINTSNHISYGVFGNAAKYLPISPIRSNTPENTELYGGYFQFVGRSGSNPVAMLNQRQDARQRNIFLGSAKVGVDLLPELTLDISATYQRGDYDRSYYMDRGDMSAQALRIGYAERIAYKNTDKIVESVLNYSHTFNNNHNVKLLGGYSYQNTIINDGLSGRNNTFSSDALGAANLALGQGDATLHYQEFPDKQESVLLSYFGRVNYNFKEKYILSATMRRDGSSKFGANNRWALFPSFGAAWNISEENFFKNQTFINDLKLRAGYGVSGNQNIPSYRSITLYGAQTSQFLSNGKWVNSYSVLQNANPNLKWESTYMFNAGVDFSILSGKLRGTVEYYDKQTKDLLYTYDVPTPPYQFPTLLANGASMSNKGIEVSLNSDFINTADWNWNSSFNLAFNKNEIGSLASNIGNLNVAQRYEGYLNLGGWTGQSATIVRPGSPLGTFYTLKYAGYNAEINKTLYENAAGEIVTSDEIRTPDDYQVVGQALPKVTYGLNNSLRYKNLDFGVFIRGVYGNKIFNATRADLSRLDQISITNVSNLAIEDGIYETPISSSRWLESGSFIRLDNATLGYTLKTSNLLNSARLYVTGQNLFVITKYTGVDPEVSLSGLAPGIDNNNFYPRTRSVILGVNLSF